MTKKRAAAFAGVLVGNMSDNAGTRVKYAGLLSALARQVSLGVLADANLYGIRRILNAARSFHPNPTLWKARFYQNVGGFRSRSRRAVQELEASRQEFDFIFQIGVTFDARWQEFPAPSLIYTDYTGVLATGNAHLGRGLSCPREQAEWNRLEAQALWRADHVFTRSDHVRKSVINDYGLPAERVTTVGGGVNFDALPALPERGLAAPTLLFIGRDFVRKGGDLLLRAYSELRKSCPAARLLMVTDGPVASGLPLAGVEFITPTYDRAVIASLYRQADIFVLPSRLETWGDVLLEAMAFGVPCVGVSGDAMEEIIVDGKTGFVVAPGDAAALGVALLRLGLDSKLRVDMGKASRRVVEAGFLWDQVVARMLPTIRHIVHERGLE